MEDNRETSQTDAPASSDMEGERDREPPVETDEPALEEDEDVGGG